MKASNFSKYGWEKYHNLAVAKKNWSGHYLCETTPQDAVLVARDQSVAHDPGTHCPVNLSTSMRVIAGTDHIQNVYAYGSRLK